jgi:putative ABC transport system permease protein
MSAFLSFLRSLFKPWPWRMAWRDSRTSRRRLLLFSTSIVLGVAALTAIGSFGQQMEEALEAQAKTLLGADLVLSTREAFSEQEDRFFQSLGGVQAREINLSSMIFFVKSGGTRLVQVRALGGGFPFYGSLETEPSIAAAGFRSGTGALVEEGLMNQFEAASGDSIRIGELEISIAGRLVKVPGETVAFAAIAPRVYIPLLELAKTKLVREGSLVRYKVYFKFSPEVNVPELVRRIRPELDKYRLSFDTVEERKKSLGRAMENLYHFLSLIGFVSLLLGGVGIASAIHIHVKQKLSTVAILRCLGSVAGQAFAIYFIQSIALGLFGAILGAGLGIVIQMAIPWVVADFLPFSMAVSISWSALGRGVLAGFVICSLFALLPLLAVRRVPPLAALRSSFESGQVVRRDPLLWFCYALLGAGIVAFSITQSRRWTFGLAFAAGIGVAFALLAGVAQAMIRVVKGRIPKTWPYVWRQGLANLYRPNNRTAALMLSLGLGIFLILTLHLVQTNLVSQLFQGEGRNQGNVVLFDIQPDQKDDVLGLLRSQNLPILNDAPIVTMRLLSIKGRSVDDLKRDPKKPVPRWTLNREYRSTYRGELAVTEKLLGGQWVGRVGAETSPVPVSLEDGIAKELRVELGDELVFDVQGVPITTVVASLREVDWKQLHPNFFVVFPLGSLEAAPAFHVLLTRVESSGKSARLQRDVVQRFPNISTVDLMLVLQTIDAILARISFVIRFMALFTVGTGLIVLASAVWTGRHQRIQESVLLRTLGASRVQMRQILTAEYFFLGVLASLTGIILALAASWGLAVFVFKVAFAVSIWPILLTSLAAVTLTVGIGLFASRGVSNHPPLEVLRSEV